MAFDAGMLAAALSEIRKTVGDGRVEKVSQPERDEIILGMRSVNGSYRILINAGANNPRLGLCGVPRENPQTPPPFCILLRKYLLGARLTEVKQYGFERAAGFYFDTRDEMGFPTKHVLVAETMGKYSNLMLLDGDGRILQVLRPVDFTTSSLRQVLPGMRYELPPAQDKINPLDETQADFLARFSAAPADKVADKWLTATYLGLSAAVAREIVWLASGTLDAACGSMDGGSLAQAFFGVVSMIKNETFSPCIVWDGTVPKEYAFMPLTQYGGLRLQTGTGAGEILDLYFESKDKDARLRQRAQDLLHVLNHAQARLLKKAELQTAELAECEKGEQYKKYGDLITSHLWQLHRGDASAVLDDYETVLEDGSYAAVTVPLDVRLSPSANAQLMYKKYAKARNAKVELARQLEQGRAELDYVEGVLQTLRTAEGTTDLMEIREELAATGYMSRVKTGASRGPKNASPACAEYRTSGGYRVLCGKNNLQNDYITHKVAEKTDYWFHVKNRPGSHVIMLCGGAEPDAKDFTEAAEIAALFSSVEGESGQIPVDYTQVRNLKKPQGAKPGFVIYHTNWTAYVTPVAEEVNARRVK